MFRPNILWGVILLLAVVAVTTDNLEKVRNREDWKGAGIKIMDADGRISTLAHTEIRGRGNWTWEKYQKKPYALKLDRPRSILGMPAHRRWVLLALYRGFIGNALAFEATRRAPALGWAPRGQFVELVLNGKFQGMYYYRYLFQDPQFVETVKRRWPAYRDNILGADGGQSYLDYLNEMVSLIEYSARRDTKLWNNGYFTLDEEVATVREGFVAKINWMDSRIREL